MNDVERTMRGQNYEYEVIQRQLPSHTELYINCFVVCPAWHGSRALCHDHKLNARIVKQFENDGVM